MAVWQTITGDQFQPFFKALARAPRAALLLDYDGTLAPFCIDPQRTVPWPGILDLLEDIMAQGRTRVLIVSGRCSKDLVPLLGLKQMPEIWGSHGWEHRFLDGRIEMPSPPEKLLLHLAQADAWAEGLGQCGARAERKPASLALHWRGLSIPAQQRIKTMIQDYWEKVARDNGLELHPFNGGMEFRIPGRHKGHVVTTILKEMPDTVLAYLGDDQTDEDAFQALRGHGLGVLVRSEFCQTAAESWLKPPNELLAFLEQWLAVQKTKTKNTNHRGSA